MSHSHNRETKYQLAILAILPMGLMLFIEVALNYYSAPNNSIFISPYLLTFLITNLFGLIVLLKGEICPSQQARLTFVLPFLLLFAFGNFIYTMGFTPKYAPIVLASLTTLLTPFIFLRLPTNEILYRAIIYCGIAVTLIGTLQYLLVYWFELPSLFNYIRANNIAQVLFAVLLTGWYLVIANSRLENFLKLLVKFALIILVLNYCWVIFVIFKLPDFTVQHHSTPVYLLAYGIYSLAQFTILAMLGWLLLGKNIKNLTAWSIAMFFSLLFPLLNIV